MKISKSTLEILNSFKNINPSLYFDGTSTYATKNVTREQGLDIPLNTVLAVAEIEEEIPEFAIYDGKQFLDVLNVFKDADIEFENVQATISNGKDSSIKYTGCEKGLISIPSTKGIELKNKIVSFNISKSFFQELNKINSYMKLERIKITGDENGVVFSLIGEGTSNNYSKTFDDIKASVNFEVYSKLRDLQLILDDYNCNIAYIGDSRYIMFLEAINYNVKYYISLQNE